TATGKPACATTGYWMIKDENSPAGKTQISQIIAAKLAGKKIRVVGSNACTRWPDGEDINVLLIQD
ncbi:MAG: hypothetical protein V2I33_01015, partial [Kangiellaceae bacterium]|nr:hypothetical protein [Kangiellaceae bacterium]